MASALRPLIIIDLPTFEAHVARTARAGVNPVITGSMGEAIHLSHAERVTLIQLARKSLDNAGLHEVPIIAGTGAGSTRETIELTKEAAAAGADYVLVIASGYFAGALAGNREALKAYWAEVSEKSPVPVMIYCCESKRIGLFRETNLNYLQTLERVGELISTPTLSRIWLKNVRMFVVSNSRMVTLLLLII
jgi:hypothetical protein